ncbi:MAG: N-acyl homoserine lactone hydrolase [Thermoleophilaceae bacterium]|nr:N-acyl homoserine lactone hydrolase [Thermoleophilaceae bacterium]
MKVHAIQTGTVSVRSRQPEGVGHGLARRVRPLLDRHWTEPLPIYAWLVEHPEGLIVVDSGETARASGPGWFPRWHPYFKLAVRFHVKPEDEIGPQLEALGFAAADVRWVVITHLHTDHAGGLGHFEHSEVVMSRTEYDEAKGFMGQLRGYLPQHWPDWFAPRLLELDGDPFGPFPDSLPLTDAGDVRIVATPGHTNGHLSVVLEDGDDTIFLAGDTSYNERLMVDGAVDGVSPDERAARTTLDRIRAFALERPLVYLPAHDADAGRRLAERRPVELQVS